MLSVATAGVVAAGLGVLYTQSADAASTLGASAAQKGRYFGTAVPASKLGDSKYTGIVNREFNMITPENEMKWDATEPSQGRFSYNGGDSILNYASSHGMRVPGTPCSGTRSSPAGRSRCPAAPCARPRSTT